MSEIIFDMRRISECDEIKILNYVEVNEKAFNHIDDFESFDNKSLTQIEMLITHLTEKIISEHLLRNSFRDFDELSLNNISGFDYYEY
jgi:hypothetical protein